MEEQSGNKEKMKIVSGCSLLTRQIESLTAVYLPHGATVKPQQTRASQLQIGATGSEGSVYINYHHFPSTHQLCQSHAFMDAAVPTDTPGSHPKPSSPLNLQDHLSNSTNHATQKFSKLLALPSPNF